MGQHHPGSLLFPRGFDRGAKLRGIVAFIRAYPEIRDIDHDVVQLCRFFDFKFFRPGYHGNFLFVDGGVRQRRTSGGG